MKAVYTAKERREEISMHRIYEHVQCGGWRRVRGSVVGAGCDLVKGNRVFKSNGTAFSSKQK